MLVTFLNILAVGTLAWSLVVIGSVTAGRLAETNLSRALDRLQGRTWRSRVPYAIAAFVAAAWLYAANVGA